MARTDLRQRIAAAREQRAERQRVRTRRTVTRRDGVRCEVDGQWLTGFCSNDYLGLSQHFAVVNALQDAASREGAGGTASHLVCGHHLMHTALETEIAEWLEKYYHVNESWTAEDRRRLLAFARDLINSDRAGHMVTFELFAQSPPFAHLNAVYMNFDPSNALQMVKNAANLSDNVMGQWQKR